MFLFLPDWFFGKKNEQTRNAIANWTCELNVATKPRPNFAWCSVFGRNACFNPHERSEVKMLPNVN